MNILIGVVVILVFIIGYLHNKVNKLEIVNETIIKQLNHLSEAEIIHAKWLSEIEAVNKYCLFRLGNFDIDSFKQSLNNHPNELLDSKFKESLIEMAENFIEWTKEQEGVKNGI